MQSRNIIIEEIPLDKIAFSDRLNKRIRETATPLVVGLDPRLHQLPDVIRSSIDSSDPDSVSAGFEEFSKSIIDVVASHVPGIKIQFAFYEQLGAPGIVALGSIIKYAYSKGLVVIADAKRGDIGSTAIAYADAYLNRNGLSGLACDALTVNPYMGVDTLKPFIDTAQGNNGGLFVLVKTSNPGGGDFQDLETGGRKLYEVVAERVELLSASHAGESGFGNVGVVAGATYPSQLAELRGLMPSCIFLVPGFGAQGGTAADVAGAFHDNGLGAVVNSSRGIIFAFAQDRYASLGWQAAVEAATLHANEELRDHTAAGTLQ